MDRDIQFSDKVADEMTEKALVDAKAFIDATLTRTRLAERLFKMDDAEVKAKQEAELEKLKRKIESEIKEQDYTLSESDKEAMDFFNALKENRNDAALAIANMSIASALYGLMDLEAAKLEHGKQQSDKVNNIIGESLGTAFKSKRND